MTVSFPWVNGIHNTLNPRFNDFDRCFLNVLSLLNPD